MSTKSRCAGFEIASVVAINVRDGDDDVPRTTRSAINRI